MVSAASECAGAGCGARKCDDKQIGAGGPSDLWHR